MPTPKFPVLETERLTLRQLKKSDAPALIALLRDEAVSRWLLNNLERTTLKQEQEYIKAMRKQFLKGQGVHWVICDKAGTPMGGIGIGRWPMDRMHNKTSAGFWLGRAYWGKGYMTEAFSAVLDYAFGTLGLNRVSAGHFQGNIASGRVQQKCGLLYEGTCRRAFLKNGAYIDELMYAIVREDWEKGMK
ncbi:MAG: GNAT family N-acetyltransferase [Firmicutes bacterium]|nr:GNAT family N-acetyltransferase [Bacillota bacterium]